MTTSTPPADSGARKDHGRAGRDLPAAITSAVVLLVAIAASLVFWKTAFMLIVAAAVVVAIWELHRGFERMHGWELHGSGENPLAHPDVIASSPPRAGQHVSRCERSSGRARIGIRERRSPHNLEVGGVLHASGVIDSVDDVTRAAAVRPLVPHRRGREENADGSSVVVEGAVGLVTRRVEEDSIIQG